MSEIQHALDDEADDGRHVSNLTPRLLMLPIMHRDRFIEEKSFPRSKIIK